MSSERGRRLMSPALAAEDTYTIIRANSDVHNPFRPSNDCSCAAHVRGYVAGAPGAASAHPVDIEEIASAADPDEE